MKSGHTTLPEIKIFEPPDLREGAGQSDSLAAAMLAIVLSSKSDLIRAAAKWPKRARAEKTRPGNPNRLTIKQHVFPLKSMMRFAHKGRLSVRIVGRSETQSAKPDNSLFCANRAWDQRSEGGWMKRIEDEFQAIVSPIVDERGEAISSRQKPLINRMYALWYMRARYRDLEEQEIQLNAITGSDLTKEQEENLETNGCSFARTGGRLPARQLNGLQLQMRVDHYAEALTAQIPSWGIISAQSGEFIVPDVPMHTIIPLSPQIALVGSVPDGVITDQNLAEINRAMRAASREYFFARDFSKCPE